MSVLFGRERELALLEEAFDKALTHQAQIVLLAGESGSGKSALLDAIAASVAARALALRGSASDAEGMPPYLPFLEALGAYIRTAPPSRLRQQCAGGAPVLAALFPELAQRLGDTPATFPMPPEQSRLRLYEAVGQFVANIAADQPLVLLLDDIHWAEAATFDLLTHIARTQRSAPVLWLIAYRSEEARRNPALERARAELNRLANASSLRLGPLAEEAIAQIAAHFLGGPTQPQLNRELSAQSDGNPFFAAELLRHWRESAQIAQSAGVWRLTELRRDDLPEGIASVVGLRLARQPAAVVETLRAAAVIGRTFDLPLLSAVTEQSIDSVELHIQQAVDAWLVQGEADGLFAFRHTQIRQTLYSQVTASRRQRWHAAVAQLLEERQPQPLAGLAIHFGRGGDQRRGALYALRAGQAAMQAWAWEEAIAQYETALGWLSATDAQRGDLLFHLGEALTLAGREADALGSFVAARVWHKQAGDLLASARAAHRLGQVYWRMEDLPNARAALQTALHLLPEEPSRDRVQLLVDLGSLLAVSLHQMAAGLALGQEALQQAQQLEDDCLLAAASRAVGNLLVRGNQLPAGIQQLEQALRLAMAADDPVEAVECCANLTLAYAWSTDFQRAHETHQLWENFARQSHDTYQLRHIYSTRAVGAIIAGDWGRAESNLDAAQAIVERLASPEPAALLRLNRGLLAYYRDDFAQATAEFDAASATFRNLGPGALVWYLGALGMALAAQGKRPAAYRVIDEVEALVRLLPPDAMPVSESLSHLTQAALWLDDRERLARYYPQLVAFRGQYHDALVDRLLGAVEILQEQWAQAHVSLARAEAVARRHAAHLELAHTLQAQAQWELAQGRRGDAGRARTKLGEVISLYHALGLAQRESQAQAQLERLSPKAPQPYPAGLSQREVEVLQLVAQGQSNRQIAERLILSEKTVGNHITNIFNKITVDNRAAAAAFAIRNHLVE